MKISIYGAGYVGLVSAVCFATLGHEVMCADVDADKIAKLRAGVSPIHEEGLEERLMVELSNGKLAFTASLKDAIDFSNVHFIATGTPSLANGAADLSQVISVFDTIIDNAKGEHCIVTKSTVPVGTGDALLQRLQRRREDAARFEIASNPEFLKEGAAIMDFLEPDRVVIGGSERGLEVLDSVYAPLSQQGVRVIKMNRSSAELTKYAANAMLACRISFMNQISQIADTIHADIDKVKEGIAIDPRIGPYFLNAGMGYGGSCFPKDVRALIHTAKEAHLDASFFEAIDRVNENQKLYFTDKLQHYFGSLAGKRVGVWGLAFKPKTDDIREASSLKLVDWLIKEGALVYAHDPVAMENVARHVDLPQGFRLCEHQYDVLQADLDALIIVTEWSEYVNVDLNLIKDIPVFDGRNCFSLQRVAEHGLKYYASVGRPSYSSVM